MAEKTKSARKFTRKQIIIAAVAVFVLLLGAGAVVIKNVVDANYAAETERLCEVAVANLNDTYEGFNEVGIEMQTVIAEGHDSVAALAGATDYRDNPATEAVEAIEAVEAEGDTKAVEAVEAVEAIEARKSGAEYLEDLKADYTAFQETLTGSLGMTCVTREDVDAVNGHAAAQTAAHDKMVATQAIVDADYEVFLADEAVRIEAERVAAEKAAAEKAAAEAAAAEAARIEAERIAAQNSYVGNGYVEGGSSYNGGGSSGGGNIGGGCVGSGCNSTNPNPGGTYYGN